MVKRNIKNLQCSLSGKFYFKCMFCAISDIKFRKVLLFIMKRVSFICKFSIVLLNLGCEIKLKKKEQKENNIITVNCN